jgi:hypothetical protein
MGSSYYGRVYSLGSGYTKPSFRWLGISLKFLTRGLFALILIITLQSQLVAEYLYKDEIIHNPKFTTDIETLGTMLYKKTGISLKLIMLKELPANVNIVKYEKEILKNISEPTILLTFSEMDKSVDIEVNDKTLYKYFNKAQVLSPVTSYVQAFMLAVSCARSIDDFKKIVSTTNGSILPLLGVKSKEMTTATKYSAAMFNGYLDIAQQIARAKGVKLGNGFDSDTNQEMLFYIKVLFYSFIFYAIIMYIKRQIYKRKHKDEYYKKW